MFDALKHQILNVRRQEPIQNLQEAEKVAKPWEAGSMPGTGGPSEDADKEAIFKTLDAFRTRK